MYNVHHHDHVVLSVFIAGFIAGFNMGLIFSMMLTDLQVPLGDIRSILHPLHLAPQDNLQGNEKYILDQNKKLNKFV